MAVLVFFYHPSYVVTERTLLAELLDIVSITDIVSVS